MANTTPSKPLGDSYEVQTRWVEGGPTTEWETEEQNGGSLQNCISWAKQLRFRNPGLEARVVKCVRTIVDEDAVDL